MFEIPNTFGPKRELSAKRDAFPLNRELEAVSQKCINCKLCQKECEFLRRYGKPKEIADGFNIEKNDHLQVAFECSLCRLCEAVCPVQVKPADMFLEMRREAVKRGQNHFTGHKRLIAYERRGISKRYTWYGLPQGCDTVFFPGCNLAGTRPEKTLQVFKLIQQKIPSVGIVLDCCTSLSHNLGRRDFFQPVFDEMKNFLLEHRITKALIACPSCYRMFEQYGGELAPTSVYEFIAEHLRPADQPGTGTVAVHDPCPFRFHEPAQSAVRRIIEGLGLRVRETTHSKEKTLCCGEGGSVKPLRPSLARRWARLRKQEQNGEPLVTYCGGCVESLRPGMNAVHVLDLYFEPNAALGGKVKVHKSPFTYWHRIQLKRYLQKTLDAAVTREREFVY